MPSSAMRDTVIFKQFDIKIQHNVALTENSLIYRGVCEFPAGMGESMPSSAAGLIKVLELRNEREPERARERARESRTASRREPE